MVMEFLLGSLIGWVFADLINIIYFIIGLLMLPLALLGAFVKLVEIYESFKKGY
jgi:hypothetical protein